MNWYKGSIAEAIKQSKSQNAIFTVFVDGEDDNSNKLRAMLNDPRISGQLNSSDFVAIEITSGSETYTQFAQIYQVVPLPSLFFIGKNGVPITIVTMALQTIEELEEKVKLVLNEKLNHVSVVPPTTPETTTITTSSAPSSSANSNDVVCEGDVCVRQSDLDAKVARAKQLIEEKRKEKEELEAKMEREKELKRRQTGVDLLEFKRKQEEMELKELKEERKRDKLLEQETRKRVLEQIAQDRAERAQRFPSTSDDSKSLNANTVQSIPQANVPKGTFTRIQFKKPTGETEMHTFNNTDNFLCVRNYVKDNALAGLGVQQFSLATTFPKKEFGDADNERSLDELNLTPSAVILILIATKSRPLDVIPNSGGFLGILSTVVMGILNPIFALLGTIKNYVCRTPNSNATAVGDQKRASEDRVSDNDAAKKRKLKIEESNTASTSKSGVFKRNTGSNIHRLADHRDSDEDDKTWNGNSTQQM